MPSTVDGRLPDEGAGRRGVDAPAGCGRLPPSAGQPALAALAELPEVEEEDDELVEDSFFVVLPPPSDPDEPAEELDVDEDADSLAEELDRLSVR